MILKLIGFQQCTILPCNKKKRVSNHYSYISANKKRDCKPFHAALHLDQLTWGNTLTTLCMLRFLTLQCTVRNVQIPYVLSVLISQDALDFSEHTYKTWRKSCLKQNGNEKTKRKASWWDRAVFFTWSVQGSTLNRFLTGIWKSESPNVTVTDNKHEQCGTGYCAC